jgi:pimeloyl-ACP methyl ester carboxylesterase
MFTQKNAAMPLPLSERQRALQGAAQLAVTGVTEATTAVQEIHRAIAKLPFTALQPLPATPVVALAHDTIADGVYGAIRGIAGAVGISARLAIQTLPPQWLPDRDAPSPAVAQAISALNGAFGDGLAAQDHPLTLGMAFAHRGRAVALTEAAFAEAYADARSTVVVFLHGLCCNETVWEFYRDGHQGRTYASRLQADLGATAVYLRYNSGLAIADNGAALAQQLDALMELYPRRIKRLILIGHSLGGLVARSAIAEAMTGETPWLQALSHLICLGSPHLGSPLERGGWRLTRALEALPFTQTFARWGRARSLGIKNLRHGHIRPEDSAGLDPDADFGTPPRACPRPAHVKFGFVGCVLGAFEDDALSRRVGDGLVPLASARAKDLIDADWAAYTRRHHLRLVNDPAVYAQIERWLRA